MPAANQQSSLVMSRSWGKVNSQLTRSFINASLSRGLQWRIQDILAISDQEFQVQQTNGNKIRSSQIWIQMPTLSEAAGRVPQTTVHQRDSIQKIYPPYQTMVAQMVKNLPTMQETWVQFLGWKDSLEEGMVTHPSILAWRIPMDRGVSRGDHIDWWAQSMWLQRVRRD